MFQLIESGKALLTALTQTLPMVVIVSGEIYSQAEEDLLDADYVSDLLDDNAITKTDQLQATSIVMRYYNVGDAPNEVVYKLNEGMMGNLKLALKQRFELIGLIPDSLSVFLQRLAEAKIINGTTANVINFPSFMSLDSPSNPFGEEYYGVTSHMGLTLHGENAEFEFRSIEYINSEYADPFDVCGCISVPITDLVNAVYS